MHTHTYSINQNLLSMLAPQPQPARIVIPTTERAKAYQQRQVELALAPIRKAESRKALRRWPVFWLAIIRLLKAICAALIRPVRLPMPEVPDYDNPAPVYMSRWAGKEI